MKDLLGLLTATYGPSGNEDPIRELIENEIKDYVDELSTDALGNLIAVKKGNGTGKKVMIAAHMDQIGLIVTGIDDKGFLRFSNIGGVSVLNIINRRVKFKDGTCGVVSYESEIDDIKKLTLQKMYIDIGAKNKEEAAERVEIGDVAVYDAPMFASCDRLSACAMDNRVGCAVAIEALKRVKESDHDLYFVFTVQEELGLRGARTSAYGIMPDIGIALDVTLTGDTPNARRMAIKLGQGPAIKVKDSSVISHPMVKNLMIKRAKEANIPYQLEVLEAGGTDSGAIHLTASGVPSGVISVPCRYVHSGQEMIDLRDMMQATDLLVAILNKDL